MKTGTHTHVKTKRLKRLLGVPLYHVVGILETMWLLCIDCCDEGNIGKFSNDEIADYLEWDGNPDELIAALVSSGWIDESDQHRLMIHDWLENCPDYIRDRIRKREAREAKSEKRREIKTYDQSEPDKPGQIQTDSETSDHVPSIPIPTHSIQTHSSPEKSARKKQEIEFEIPEALNQPPFIEAWEEWKAHRKEIKAKLTPTSVKQQMRELESWGITRAIAAIRHSIKKGYQGLFEESQGGFTKQHPPPKPEPRPDGFPDVRIRKPS